MSSCFLCDTTYILDEDNVHFVILNSQTGFSYYMAQLPIIRGSTGLYLDDQQHENNNKQNYVSYRVKRIEFCYNVEEAVMFDQKGWSFVPPSYILIFKVPYREPAVNFDFIDIKKFMLYSEPESVLKYDVYNWSLIKMKSGQSVRQKKTRKYELIIDKPFIVGPNDYVGVLYMFIEECKIASSARVWFDIV